MNKQQQYFVKVAEFRERFGKVATDALRTHLANGPLVKEAAVAIREILQERERGLTDESPEPAARVWANSNGGPLLLLPMSALPDWHGANGGVPPAARNAADAGNDYERACSIADYTGIISVGEGAGLVLGEEPNDTTWIPDAHGGTLARWVYAEENEHAEAMLDCIPGDLNWRPAGHFNVSDSTLELFDSAEAGAEPVGLRLRIQLEAGTYEVGIADYKPDADTCFQLIRLRRAAT